MHNRSPAPAHTPLELALRDLPHAAAGCTHYAHIVAAWQSTFTAIALAVTGDVQAMLARDFARHGRDRPTGSISAPAGGAAVMPSNLLVAGVLLHAL